MNVDGTMTLEMINEMDIYVWKMMMSLSILEKLSSSRKKSVSSNFGLVFALAEIAARRSKNIQRNMRKMTSWSS